MAGEATTSSVRWSERLSAGLRGAQKFQRRYSAAPPGSISFTSPVPHPFRPTLVGQPIDLQGTGAEMGGRDLDIDQSGLGKLDA